MVPFLKTVGAALRRARRARGFTLRDVAGATQNRYKASALGAYERGERSISLARFQELAEFYGASPDRLLAEVLEELDPLGRGKLVIDLQRLRLVSGIQRDILEEFIGRIREQRGDHGADVITLRSGDLQILASTSAVSPQELLSHLRPALEGSPSGSG